MINESKLCFLDAEFNGTNERDLNVVCISCELTNGTTKSFWTYGKNYREAASYFYQLKTEGYTFVSFVAEAEVRALKSIVDIDWVSANWIDLYLEYRCLLNQNDKLAYGEQYIKGKVITTSRPPKKWEVDTSEEDDPLKESGAHHSPQYSLAAATYKLLGIMIDTERKNLMRDIIISRDAKAIEAHKQEILDYNLDDIKNLKSLLRQILINFGLKGVSSEIWEKAALSRGHYAALTAYMISRGYPVNKYKTDKLSENVAGILKEETEAVLSHLPNAFVWSKKEGRYKKQEKAIRDWIPNDKLSVWPKTKAGKLSLSVKAFSKFYTSETPGFAGAFCHYLKTVQSLNGFSPNSKHKFNDFMGSDERVRPHFGIYGAQTSRSQPKAAAFIPLKSHWMRTFIEPKGNRAIVGFDYASQEFLLAALLSKDKVMADAYASGDVYLAFAKAAGLVPPDATKSSHKKERDVCKSSVLGMSYEMGAQALALKMTSDTGELVTKEVAQTYIDLFAKTYKKYTEWKSELIYNYRDSRKSKLLDGWYLWGDQDNWRSVINFPVQGTGAVIMRKAVSLCHERDIEVIFTLHDAVYAEMDYSNLTKMRLFKKTMLDAFDIVMAPYRPSVGIRVDGYAWSKKYGNFPLKYVDDIELATSYFDDKCKAGLERFSKYLI